MFSEDRVSVFYNGFSETVSPSSELNLRIHVLEERDCFKQTCAWAGQERGTHSILQAGDRCMVITELRPEKSHPQGQHRVGGLSGPTLHCLQGSEPDPWNPFLMPHLWRPLLTLAEQPGDLSFVRQRE